MNYDKTKFKRNNPQLTSQEEEDVDKPISDEDDVEVQNNVVEEVE